MMYSVMALDVLGYRQGSTRCALEALRQFDSLMVDDGERFFFQPCFSPVWDTAIARVCAGAERIRGTPALGARGRLAARSTRSGARATGR